MLIVGDPPARMCKADDVFLALTLLEKKSFENRMKPFSNVATTVASQNLEKNHTERRETAIFILIAPDYSDSD